MHIYLAETPRAAIIFINAASLFRNEIICTGTHLLISQLHNEGLCVYEKVQAICKVSHKEEVFTKPTGCGEI